MNNNNTLCSLCNKTLKNLRRLHIHQKAVHQTNTKSELFLCPHCSRAYKTKGGLCRHKTFKHYNYNIPGPQSVSSPMTESEFVCTFQNHIQRYSICQQKYICRFEGYDAYDTLVHILNNANWGKRVFEHGQWSEIVLVSNSLRSTKNIKPLRSSFQINPETPEMIIIWKKKKINNEKGNISLTGWITLKFL
ncbi:17614_t:CDS:2, partial [Gigaspora rosea]